MSYLNKSGTMRTGGNLDLPLLHGMIGGSRGRGCGRTEMLTTSLRCSRRRMEGAGAATVLARKVALRWGAANVNFDGGGGHHITEAHYIILQLVVEVTHTVQLLFQLLFTTRSHARRR